MHDKLSSFTLPVSLFCSDPKCQDFNHSADRDSLMLDIISSIIETSYECIPVSGKKQTVKPDCHLDKCIPGGKYHIQPYKDEANFWHAVWLSADRPNTGVLKELMNKTRNKYHYAIRRTKKIANTLRAKMLLEASLNSPCELVKEMKRVKDCNKGEIELLEIIGNAQGEESMAELFISVYSDLYNSCSTLDKMIDLKSMVDANINDYSMVEANMIIGDVGKSAASKLRPNKCNISGSFTSDSIHNSPDILFELIALLYRSWLVHGTVTLSPYHCSHVHLYPFLKVV